MVAEGSKSPDFTVPKAGGSAYNDASEFSLREALGEGPIVLAFYWPRLPAAVPTRCVRPGTQCWPSRTSTHRSTGSAWTCSSRRTSGSNNDLDFLMLSGWNHDIIHSYGVVRGDIYDMIETACRSVFVVNGEGTVQYKWLRERNNPDLEALTSTVQDQVAEAA